MSIRVVYMAILTKVSLIAAVLLLYTTIASHPSQGQHAPITTKFFK